jgi:hypothetical protein
VLLELARLPRGAVNHHLLKIDVPVEQVPGAEDVIVVEGLKLVVIQLELESFEVDYIANAAGRGEVRGVAGLEEDGEVLAVDEGVERVEVEGVVYYFDSFYVELALFVFEKGGHVDYDAHCAGFGNGELLLQDLGEGSELVFRSHWRCYIV